MKITACFLIIAASCCFTPAISTCISKCVKSCHQVRPKTDPSCLLRALSNNPATVNALINFLCAYDRCKEVRNKSELIKAVQKLLNTSGCTIENLLGTNGTIDDLIKDVNGTLRNLLRITVNLLSALNLPMITTPLCGSLNSLLLRITTLLNYITGLPELDGVTQTIEGITRHLGLREGKVPGTLTLLNPGLIGGLTAGVGELLSGLGGSISGIGGVSGILEGLTKGDKGGIGGTSEGVTSSITGVVSEDLGGLTKGLEGVTNVNSADVLERNIMSNGEIDARLTNDIREPLRGTTSGSLTDGSIGSNMKTGGLPEGSINLSGGVSADLNSDVKGSVELGGSVNAAVQPVSEHTGLLGLSI